MSSQLDTLLATVLKLTCEQIRDDLELKDVPRWDSLQHMNLVVALESQFKVQFTFEEIASMTSVSRIRSQLKEKRVLA